MKVSEAIKQLQSMDPDAELLLAINPSWPFSCEVSHIKTKHTKVYIVDNNKSTFIDIESDMDIFKP